MIDNNIYDVCIVGAGVAGSTCAFYLAKLGINTVVLEKKKFPRDKICGDALFIQAQIHLKRMGVLQEVLKENKGKWAASGGLVSPSGIEYYGDSSKEEVSHLAIAIKRKILDEKMINAAIKQGAKLIEEYSVTDASLSHEKKFWTIMSDETETVYKAKILIIADGSPSRLGRKLGFVDGPAQATCSRAYIESGSHEYPYDGVTYYPSKLVPGYCSLFKQANGDVGYCCYIIPGGKATIGDLRELHHEFIANDPYMSKAIGPNPKLEKMKAAPIRSGGIDKSFSDNLMIVGDAAGHNDPLTGGGIQYSMDAAEIAANTAKEALSKNTFHKKFFSRYQKKWMKAFGRDFKWSQRMINVFVKRPIFIDAFAEVCNKKGDKFMREWAKIMCGARRKVTFFTPRLALPLLFATMRLKRKNRKKAR
ncbi:MAG: NAD(P)/FAD-dependent oxidoreductase [Asgard group archaeon]|nr:NAD(P)/FAD-dependent oxidoreductase [Asgard group archaeon]